MNESFLVVGLFVIIALQHAYWSYTTHKLIDKLMSRSYHEYEAAKNYEVKKRPQNAQDGPAEDLGVLNDYNPI